MFDLNAPIVPGESAAGVRVGQPMEDILTGASPDAVVEMRSCIKFEFGPVRLWAENGRVVQVGVYAGYRGSLRQGIGVGSTLGEVQSALGPIAEDEDDNLIVAGMPGWCFETEEWAAGRGPEQNPDARVREIYVFAAAS
jgi:hypothetical protein